MTHFRREACNQGQIQLRENPRERWWFMLVWRGYIKERRKPSQNTTRIQGKQVHSHGRGSVKAEFATLTLPSILEVEAYASNESSTSDYCRFAQVLLSLPPMEGVDLKFDLGIEYDNSGPSDGAIHWFVLYADGMLWCHLVMMKDLQPEYLGWYLQ